ncbi:MAG TPA: ATPase [Bacillota bacterium]|nr:ATPase [Bacillota bacterium]HPT87623.1 ATPase [Bacillota bacterium]
MTKMNLLLLIERLQETINSNFQIAGKILVDREELEELIEKIQIALPDEIKQAEWVSREKERYLQQANEEARKIISEAEAYAEELIRQDRILLKAEEEAARIIQNARLNAEEIENEARDYANRILERLEESLDRTLKVVREGRESLLEEDTNS